MRILIQQKETGLYFRDVGAWTLNPSEAMDFLTLYQTERRNVAESVAVRDNVRMTSGLWRTKGAKG